MTINSLIIKLGFRYLLYIIHRNRDAEEQEDKNSIWLKEADLSTLSVDKEVTKLFSQKESEVSKCPGFEESWRGAEEETGQKG